MVHYGAGSREPSHEATAASLSVCSSGHGDAGGVFSCAVPGAKQESEDGGRWRAKDVSEDTGASAMLRASLLRNPMVISNALSLPLVVNVNACIQRYISTCMFICVLTLWFVQIRVYTSVRIHANYVQIQVCKLIQVYYLYICMHIFYVFICLCLWYMGLLIYA